MRVIELRAENFKRLKALEITGLEQGVVVIGGENAQGKSSVLDAIWAAIAGRAGSKNLDEPIRKGQTEATVSVTLDEMVVTRTWSIAGTKLVVTPRDGATHFTSPQRMLDGLIGSLSFDPLAFANAKPAEQRDILIDLTGARDQFDQITADRKNLYDQRTDVNRAAKSARAKLDGLPALPAAGANRPDMKAIQAELKSAYERQRLLEEWHSLERQRLVIIEMQADVVAKGQALPAGRDVEQMDVIATSATQELSQWMEYDRRLEATAEANDLEAQSSELTAGIHFYDQAKLDLLAQSPMPIQGLAFTDDEVTFGGVPLSQASGAERIKISVAMAMAKNPDLRVIRITDGSLLDSASMAMLQSAAKANDFQIWVERVGSADGIGVIIEDGEVKQ